MMSAVRRLLIRSVVFIPFTFSLCTSLACASKLMSNVEKVDHRDNEHPNQVDEVPVQRPDFDVVGVIAAAFVAERDNAKGDKAADHVRQMKARDREEGGAKHGRAPGVLKEAHAFADQLEPLADVEKREQNAAGDRNKGPADGAHL